MYRDDFNINNSDMNYYIGRHSNYIDYQEGYKNVVNELYQLIKSNTVRLDDVAIPFLYMMRHCIEIAYKKNNKFMARYSKIEYRNRSHRLAKLITDFIAHFNQIIEYYKLEQHNEIVVFFREYIDLTTRLTDFFDSVDKGSFSFRYPDDKSGKLIFERTCTLNVGKIYDAF